MLRRVGYPFLDVIEKRKADRGDYRRDNRDQEEGGRKKERITSKQYRSFAERTGVTLERERVRLRSFFSEFFLTVGRENDVCYLLPVYRI